MEPRHATVDDIGRIVAIHTAAFDSFLLTSLGPRFLARLYAGYINHPGGVVLVATEPADGRIVGFVAGTTQPEAFYSWLLRSHGISLGLMAAPALLRRPLVVGRRLVSAVRYRGRESGRIAGAALLASIAVDPGAAGRGLGSTLVDSFAAWARAAGHDLTYLSTDAGDNERVIAFYRRLGFQEVERVRRSGGREMAVMIRENGGPSSVAEPG